MCGVWCFIFVIMCTKVFCQMNPENVTSLLLKYERYMKASHDLDKSDKALLKSWDSVSRMDQVNVTSHYRLEMIRHKEHNFRRRNVSRGWLECMSLHEREIKKTERNYYSCEGECLQVASMADRRERRGVHQVAKEIKKWRKSYQYLAKQCHLDNPGNDEAVGACLVEYIQRDNYDVSLQRLINLKQKSIGDVYLKMAISSSDLKECLKTCLSRYLEEVRKVMDTLHVYYLIKHKSKE